MIVLRFTVRAGTRVPSERVMRWRMPLSMPTGLATGRSGSPRSGCFSTTWSSVRRGVRTTRRSFTEAPVPNAVAMRLPLSRKRRRGTPFTCSLHHLADWFLGVSGAWSMEGVESATSRLRHPPGGLETRKARVLALLTALVKGRDGTVEATQHTSSYLHGETLPFGMVRSDTGKHHHAVKKRQAPLRRKLLHFGIVVLPPPGIGSLPGLQVGVVQLGAHTEDLVKMTMLRRG